MLLPQRHKPLDFASQGTGICGLALRVGAIPALILGNIKFLFGGGGKTGVHSFVPLHGAAGAGPAISAFHGDQVLHIAHPDFISIVDKGRAGHGEQKGEGNLHLFLIQAAGQSVHIMVPGGDTDESFSAHFRIIFPVSGHKFPGAAPAPSGKIGFVAAEQIVVVRGAEMQQEIHVETGYQGFVGFSPLGDHDGSGEFPVQELTDILPQGDSSLTFFILLYQGACHIHPEAVTAHFQPETHNVFQCFPGGHGSLAVHGLLPFAVRVGPVETVVERGLMGEEVHGAGTVPGGYSPDAAHALGLLPDTVRPDIAVRIRILFCFHGFPEPGMGHCRMTRNQVQQHMHVPFMGFPEQIGQVLVGAVPGSHRVIVFHIVARVSEGGKETGVKPEGGAAQVPDIVQLSDNAGNVPDAVGIGITKGLGVDLVEYGFVQPGSLIAHDDSSCFRLAYFLDVQFR